MKFIFPPIWQNGLDMREAKQRKELKPKILFQPRRPRLGVDKGKD